MNYQIKLYSKTTNGRKWCVLKCPNCGIEFEKPKNQTYLDKPQSYTCCSHKCSGEFSHKIKKYGETPEIKDAISTNVLKEYCKYSHKEIKPRLDKVLGYMYFCDVDHPLASKGGKVYYHRHVASMKIGRWLKDDEHVHHIDENKTNNNPDNLEVLSHSEHAALHNPLMERVVVTCQNCGIEFEHPASKERKFCSPSCASKNNEKIKWPSDKELEKLVWEIPRIRLAEQLGVSDKAIAKRCKTRDIPQPPRGYWAKKKSKNK